ncbi:STAS domain-containing protein [Kineococcus rhizosphaerae]|uniref:Anti-anti-sigma factor n=1 Tax=Kineococcus rhizosphaerae TaxID=559628 RepID=A0A2T0QWW6_9ACTN|nr:STAS domain-containing protein [Kineococcus rhizosphaerae]PRY10062.1 anti-anti-sigma factor [Kineococcus rhizosphaerae]
MDGTALEHGGDGPVLVLDDDGLRQGLSALRRHAGPLLDADPTGLVVDVSRLSSLSSTTVAVLLRTRRLCRARGGRLTLQAPQRHVVAILRRAGLEELFDMSTADTAGADVGAAVPGRRDPVPAVGGG